jgi:hypothetical protein
MRKQLKPLLLIVAGVIVGVLVAPQTAQAAINYFDQTQRVSGTGTASCPSGWKVTGGGVASIHSDYFGSYSSDEYSLTGSYPTSTTQWRATANRVHGTYSSSSGWRFSNWSYSPTVYAICTR